MSSKIFSIMATAIFSVNSWASSEATEYPLYSATDTKTSSSTPERITYRSSNLDERGFNRVIENITVPTLTVYRPTETKHRGAAIVVCPGGGYQYVVIDREGHMIARYFQQQGLTVIVLKYRLPHPDGEMEGLPDSQRDVLAAIQFVRSRADEWGVDKHRIGVLGASAGGHLATSAAIFGDAVKGSRPDFVGLLYPVISLRPPYAHSGSRDNLLGPNPSVARVEAFSFELRVRADLPPFFIAHARDDQAVPIQNSMLMADALRAVGVPVELHQFAVGNHGFALGRGPESAHWKDQFLGWLDALP